nr:AIF_HP1_G0010820.mRNA.1.CDS.1 [Saccharomyces cerevisiae]
MLFLNKDLNNNDNITTITDDIFNQQEIIWKVLILDIKSTATISSVLRVNDLLKAGITVHSLIKQDRSPLPDVPAIYFVSPTKENIDIIVNDLKKRQKFQNAYLTLNDPKTTEEEITGLCANIADGLFNTVLTINSIPIIRAAKGGPAEIIAEKLGTKLRDFVINTNSSSTSTFAGK